jgi:hypothetical protein
VEILLISTHTVTAAKDCRNAEILLISTQAAEGAALKYQNPPGSAQHQRPQPQELLQRRWQSSN